MSTFGISAYKPKQEACQMKDILSCVRSSSALIQSHLLGIRSSIDNKTSAFPKLYVDWIQTMLCDGSAIFRLFALIVHTLFDEKTRTILFHGERPENVIAFTERLQDALYSALLGRKTDGTSYTQAEISASRYQRIADIVCSLQHYYISI